MMKCEKIKHIDLVSSDNGDWIGLYVNGKLEAEGHSLSEYQVIEALGFKVRYHEINFEDYNFVSCPLYLENIFGD